MGKNLENLHRVVFEPGEFLFKEGDHTYFFYIIESGEVEIFLQGKKPGERIALTTATEGQAVGEFAMILKKPRSATAQAKIRCTAVKVPEDAYRTLLKDLPTWSVCLIESLIERLRHTDELIQQETKKTLALNQIFEILKDLTK